MINLMHSRHLQLVKLTVVSILLVSLSWSSVSAAGVSSMAAQQNNCRITVKAGWTPYIVQAADTLETLAERGDTTVTDLMQANCLTTETIEVGDLLLTPKLGPAVSPATPTSEPIATALPTEAPTEMPTEVPTAMPTATAVSEPAATPAAANPVVTVIEESTAVAAEPTATSDAAADNPTAAVAVAETPATATPAAEAAATEEAPAIVGNGNGTPSSPVGPNTLVTISLLIMGAVSALFFALQPRPRQKAVATTTGQVTPQGAAWGGNFAFLIGGFVIGVVLFPMVQIPSFTTIPTWLSGGAAVGLILLLAIKEVFLGAIEWRGLNRALNLGIAPLLMIFLLSVVSRFAGIVQ